MEILYLSQRFPYPPDRGDRIHTFNHVKQLSRSHRVHVASLLTSRREDRHVREMKTWAASVTVAYRPSWKTGLGKLLSFLTGKPLTLGHFGSRHLRSAIRKLVAGGHIEAVAIFSSSMAQYVEEFPRLIRVMNFCDLDSHKWSDLAENASGFRRWIYRREARLLLDYEREIAKAFDASCVVSDQEAELFRRFVPGVPVTVLASGVDHEYFGALPWRPPAELRLTFVGVMDYEPNVEGAVFFANEIWPKVRARFPKGQCFMVGSRPNNQVLALANIDGITITGSVPDVRPYLAESTLVVVPLKVARGVQNKILEAMAANVPVLTTPAAAGGLLPEARETLFIAERDPKIFLDHLLHTLADPEAMKNKAAAARLCVRQHYSWEKTGDVLAALLTRARKA